MSKKVVRYFFGFIEAQQKWLNTMARKGYRLISTGKLVSEFEACKPSEFQYCVDFVAEKSNDGKPFELHTTAEDKLHYYRKQRNACLTLMFLGVILFVMGWYQTGILNAGTITALALSILAAIPSFLFQQKL